MLQIKRVEPVVDIKSIENSAFYNYRGSTAAWSSFRQWPGGNGQPKGYCSWVFSVLPNAMLFFINLEVRDDTQVRRVFYLKIYMVRTQKMQLLRTTETQYKYCNYASITEVN